MVCWNTFIIYNNPPPPLAPVFSLSVKNGPVRLMSIMLTWFTMTFFFLLARVLFYARVLTKKKTKNRNIKKASDIQGESLWLNVWDENTNKRDDWQATQIFCLCSTNGQIAMQQPKPQRYWLYFVYFWLLLSITFDSGGIRRQVWHHRKP